MRTTFLLALLLAGCASPHGTAQEFHRGTYVSQPPTPASTRPTYTPHGAGTPTRGQPGQMGGSRGVPRSPNKRVLPPSKEPGLWAADGAPRASRGGANEPQIFGIFLPLPKEKQVREIVPVPKTCADSMNTAIHESGSIEALMSLSEAELQCFAAHLYFYCSSTLLDRLERRRLMVLSYDAAEYAHAKDANDAAFRFQKEACDSDTTTRLFDLLNVVSRKWRK